MKTTRRKSERGVTLIEMLVVITIIGLISGLVAVNVIRQENASAPPPKRRRSGSFNALGIYKLTGVYPPPHKAASVARNPGELSNWAGPYMPKDVPMDPWGRPYEYKYPGDHGEDPDIISLGADGQPGGDGTNADIQSWTNK
jgi:general secretion pathway protein G